MIEGCCGGCPRTPQLGVTHTVPQGAQEVLSYPESHNHHLLILINNHHAELKKHAVCESATQLYMGDFSFLDSEPPLRRNTNRRVRC